MRQLISFLTLALLPAAASAVILFNAGAEITATGAFPASKETGQGGLILYLKGDPDGATIDLETQPFRSAQGPIEWIPLAECSVTVLPAVCKVAVGQGDIRLNITGGLGSPAIHAIAYEASAVVGEVGGDGGGGTAVAIDADQDGTNNVFLASDTITFDTDDDGVVDFEFLGSGAGTTSTLTLVGDAPLDRSFAIVFENSGTIVQLNASTQANSGILVTPSQVLINAVVASSTVPVFIPLLSDKFTGVGRDTVSGGLSLTDNGVEGLRVLSTEVLIMPGLTFGPPPDTSPPVTCDGDSDGHLYDDTDQDLLCRCDGTTWAGVGGGATCT